MRFATYVVDESFAGLTVYEVLRQGLHASDRAVRHARNTWGLILLDGENTRCDARVAAGQEVALCISDEHVATKFTDVVPQEHPLDVVFADEDLLLVNKPAGMVMHPSRGHKDATMINFLAHYWLEQGRVCNPHPVQRLDKDTTGLVVFATSAFVQDRLQDQLHTTRFVRTYLALCTGVFEQKRGTVCAPIARMEDAPGSFDVHEGGKHAVTHYEVLREADSAEGPLSLVRLVLETGRTHQIRVHMRHLGHALLGDATYGAPSALIDRTALHSWRVELDHPMTHERVMVEAPLPADMAKLLDQGPF